MDIRLNNLWDVLINYGYETRIKNKDGLDRWNFVKKLFPDFKIEWTNFSKTIYQDLLDLGVIEDEAGSGLSHEDWERHHYLLQHGRIIHNNPEGSLVRLMQIAYNIGQFRAEQEKKVYPVKQLTYYRSHKLEKLNTYITYISKLPDGIIDELKSNIEKLI
jgi:hypothetical protein